MGVAAYNRGSKRIRDSIQTPDYHHNLPGSVLRPVAEPDDSPRRPASFQVGETVYCRVTALRGRAETIVAVKGDRIKVAGYGPWCPAYNFQREPT